MAVQQKRDRIEFRPSAELKRKFEEAASLEGQTLTEFLTRSAERSADEVIARHRTWRLEGADAEWFVALLMNPPEPNEYLRESVRLHSRDVESR